jgi:hypothetical protein
MHMKNKHSGAILCQRTNEGSCIVDAAVGSKASPVAFGFD